MNRVTASELRVDGADLAYSRLMLLHQADAAKTLANAARLLRPQLGPRDDVQWISSLLTIEWIARQYG